jgi:hypothetical protein
MEINREGVTPDPRHSLSPEPIEIADIQITHERETQVGRFYAGIGYATVDDIDGRESDTTVFLRWSSR